MTTQNLVLSCREDAIFKSYEVYKQQQALYDEHSSDPASLAHSLSILDTFVAQEARREDPQVRCTALDLNLLGKDDDTHSAFRATESTGPAGIDNFLSRLLLPDAPLQRVEVEDKEFPVEAASFLVVENLCPETVVKLGLALRIPPPFWSEYLESRPWFWKRQVAPQWPTLPSVQAKQGFTKTQWVVPRAFRWKGEDEDGEEATLVSVETEPLLFVESDSRTSRLNRIAGFLRRNAGDREQMSSIAFIRETLMVWMSRENCPDLRLVGKT